MNAFELSPPQKLAMSGLSVAGRKASTTLCSGTIVKSHEIDALKQKANDMIAQYELLRTRIGKIEGMLGPVQIVEDKLHLDIETLELDVSPLLKNADDKSLTLFIVEHKQSFLLQEEENFKLARIDLHNDDVLLVLVFNHWIMDAGAVTQFMNELFDSEAQKQPQPSEEQDEELQYVDVSEWLHELCDDDDEDAKIGKAYWAEYLNQEKPAISLPCEQRHFSTQDSAHSEVVNTERVQHLSSEDLNRLQDQLSAAKLTDSNDLQAYLLACWQTVLIHYSGLNSFSHYCVLSGRELDELSGVIGILEKALPLCDDFSEEINLRDLTSRNRQQLEQHSAQLEYFNLEQNSQEDHWLSQHKQQPQVYFQLNDQAKLAGHNKTSSAVVYQNNHARLHLQNTRLSSGALSIVLDSQCAIGGSILSAILDAYVFLVKNGIHTLDENIQSLRLMSPAALSQLDEVLNSNYVTSNETSSQTILNLFKDSVEKHPEKTAVVSDSLSYNYADLDARSDHIAKRLIADAHNSNDAQTTVMLFLHRAPDMIATILGVLKAGFAYLPIDPQYPQDRIAFIIEDAAVKTIISDLCCKDALPSQQSAKVLLVEDIISESQPNDVTLTNIQPSDNAYIIYTSGSTGNPKGVVVGHDNLLSSTRARLSYYGKGDSLHYLLLSSYAFDSSLAGIFYTLTSGGCLHLLADGLERNIDLIADYITSHQISMLLALPTYYGLILESFKENKPLSLETVIVAGESCTPDKVSQHFEVLPHSKLYNEYGPTEGTVWATVHECHLEDSTRLTVPIGKPIQSTRAWVLDQHQQVLPHGAVGELWISGPGITKGYLNQPELTAERFKHLALDCPKHNGAADAPETYAYRTGDQVVIDKNANLQFLGRLDQQIKLRGYRIELEDIEAVINRCEGVTAAAVVIVQREDLGDQRLVAYIEHEQQADFSLNTLREYLAGQLPEFMLPQHIQIIESLPLNANGKIDRKFLAKQETLSSSTVVEYVEPSSEVEIEVAQLWETLLSIDKVGQKDNFFLLGGNSLLVPRAVKMLRDTFSIDLPFSVLFEHPELGDLAEAIEALTLRAHLANKTESNDDNGEREEFTF